MALQTVHDWFVVMKHKKLLAKRQKERERKENKGNQAVLVYSRRKKGMDGKESLLRAGQIRERFYKELEEREVEV